MIAPFTLTYVTKVKCHLCDATVESEATFYAGQEITRASLPAGWRGPIVSAVFCPKHTITIKIDDSFPVNL